MRLVSIVLMLMMALPASAQQSTQQGEGALLRGLNKVTGRTQDIELKSGGVARYGRLTIALRECRYPAGNRSGDAFAGLDILEDGAEEPVFRGWMMASAPALSAMDHAQYDIWVIRCTTS